MTTALKVLKVVGTGLGVIAAGAFCVFTIKEELVDAKRKSEEYAKMSPEDRKHAEMMDELKRQNRMVRSMYTWNMIHRFTA